MKNILLLLAVVTSAAAFRSTSRSITSTTSTTLFGGGRGHATTLEGKQATVSKVRELLEKSEMVISVPASGIKVMKAQSLRRSLPQGTTMQVVKNKLMNRAIEGTAYEAVGDGLLKGANMWFFIEEDIGGTVKAFNAFVKEAGLKDSHAIIGGNIEGKNYDEAGVTAISKLPTKLELIAQIAGGIKAVPTKIARVVKAPGIKVARAIKLAGEKLNE